MGSGSAFDLIGRAETSDGVQADFRVSADSILFSGHFPKAPVLPGIGLLAMVETALSADGEAEGRRLAGLRRVKFRLLVETSGVFSVHLVFGPAPERGSFKVTLGGDLAADGIWLSEVPVEPYDVPEDKARLGLDIEEFIPHRRPMRLVDDLLEVDEDRAVSRSTVSEAWPLVDSTGGSRVLLVEAVAQTASAIIGWERRATERVGGQGYLVGIRNAGFGSEQLPVGADLLTSVTTLRKRSNYAAFEGVVTANGALLGSAAIQAFRP